VGLAQALIHDPEVLILDEPTVGLDPKQVSEARGLIKSMRSERTVIYSTHILSEVAATCDRIIIINQGKIVAQEAINSMGATGATTKTELVVQRSSEDLAQSLRSVKGVRSVQLISNGKERVIVETDPTEDVMAQIAKVAVDKNAGLIQMSPVQLALEDYYLNLISGKRGISI
jgi:ABC-2 type transport system ATP-binding protein